MLRAFGARLERPDARTVTLHPGPLCAAAVQVPGDISSAAFLLVAGLIVPDARVTVRRVGVNPTRTGLLDVLAAMRAPPSTAPQGPGDAAGEPLGAPPGSHPSPAATTIAAPLLPRPTDAAPAL